MDKIQQRIEFIKSKLKQWANEYYVQDKPTVSDADYDLLLNELIQLEKDNPHFKTNDSPTSKVGGTVSTKFNKIRHNISMLSLSNAFSSEDLLKFDNDVKKETNKTQISYNVEPKIDGLSISLYYESGKLGHALTRGDGTYGEDVTINIKTIKNIPLNISYHKNLQVRGEIFMMFKDFDNLNRSLPEADKFVNPRNAAAGSLRNLDSSITAKRNLMMCAYYIPDDKHLSDLKIITQSQLIKKLESLGFYTVKGIKRCDNIQEAINHIQYLENHKNNLGFPIDGAVVKVDDISLYDSIGYTSKFPKWAIAYKFAPEIAKTKLLDIVASVGRTGKITYVANLKPVELNGSTIRSATLHNADYIINNDIRIGDYVKIYKAAEIIPKVLGPDLNKRSNNSITYTPITNCPECGSVLIKELDEVDQYCPNISCKARALAAMSHFTSKRAMNIMLLSEMTLAKFFDHNIITNIHDIYLFPAKKEMILSLDLKIKEKAFNNIVSNINNSKNNSLERLLFALGIRHVGEVMSKVLAKRYRTIDNLAHVTFDELVKINDIGEVVAKSIVNFFSNEKNKVLIEQLKADGVNTSYISQADDNIDTNSKYYQKTFVITGSFDISRHEIKNLLERKYDANVIESINKNVDYLIVGKNPGTKLEKAKNNNIEIVDKVIW